MGQREPAAGASGVVYCDAPTSCLCDFVVSSYFGSGGRLSAEDGFAVPGQEPGFGLELLGQAQKPAPARHELPLDCLARPDCPVGLAGSEQLPQAAAQLHSIDSLAFPDDDPLPTHLSEQTSDDLVSLDILGELA